MNLLHLENFPKNNWMNKNWNQRVFLTRKTLRWLESHFKLFLFQTELFVPISFISDSGRKSPIMAKMFGEIW